MNNSVKKVRGEKILVIDDDDGDRKLIEAAIIHLDSGVHIIMAKSGEEGIHLAKENQPGIAIVDTNLTGIDGFETCQRIKAITDCKTKVIIITGAVDAIDAVKARKHGADDYCAKSSDFDDLIEIVKEMSGVFSDKT